MAEDFSIAFKIDSKEAQAGLAAVEKTVGTLSGTLKGQLEPAAKAASDALVKMANAETPRALQRGIIDSTNAMDRLKTAIDQARSSGEKIPTSMTGGLKTMQVAIDGSTKKLGQMRDQMADVRTKSDAMGQGWSLAASSGGSLNSMINNLEASSGGAIQAMSRMALTGVGLVAAFKAGMEAGKMLSEGLKSLGVDINVSGEAWAKFAGLLAKTGIGEGASKWLTDLSHSTEDYSKLLEPLPGKINAVLRAQQALAREIAASDKVLKDLGLNWVTAGAGAEKLDKQIDAVAKRFAEAAKSGEPLNKTVLANAAAMKILDEGLKEQGVALASLNPLLQAAVFIHREMRTAQESAAAGAKAAADGLLAERDALKALQDQYEKQRDMDIKTISERNKKAFDEEKEAVENLADAFGRVTGNLTEMKLAGDQAAAGLAGVAWEMRKATKETFTLNDAQNELIESLAKISDAGGASSLWVGHLIAQLENGTISFDEFTSKVNQLLRELTKLGPVMGNTAQELNDINTLLGKFKNESTEGWPGGAGGRP